MTESFRRYLEENYESLIKFSEKFAKRNQDPYEVVSVVIDYFATHYTDEKIDDIIKRKMMDGYIRKSIYANCIYRTAPYYQKIVKPIMEGITHHEYNFDTMIDEREGYDSELDEFRGIVTKLINSDYVKGMYMSKANYAYATRVYMMIYDDKDLTISELSRRTGIAKETLGYNIRKLTKIIRHAITDRAVMQSVLPGVNLENKYIEKNLDKDMTFNDIMEAWKSKLPNIKRQTLMHAASQKLKKDKGEITERDKQSIAIELMYHRAVTNGMPATLKYLNERVRLVNEYMDGKLPYKDVSCPTCMDKLTRYMNNIISLEKSKMKNGD